MFWPPAAAFADLPLTQVERSLLALVLDLELTKPLTGGVVVITRGLTGEFQGALPRPVGEVRDLGRIRLNQYY